MSVGCHLDIFRLSSECLLGVLWISSGCRLGVFLVSSGCFCESPGCLLQVFWGSTGCFWVFRTIWVFWDFWVRYLGVLYSGLGGFLHIIVGYHQHMEEQYIAFTILGTLHNYLLTMHNSLQKVLKMFVQYPENRFEPEMLLPKIVVTYLPK